MIPLKKLSLTHYIFLGLFLGALAGWLAGESILPIAEPLAEIFLRLLRMAIMPQIITSIISGVVSVGHAAGLGRLGIKHELRGARFCGVYSDSKLGYAGKHFGDELDDKVKQGAKGSFSNEFRELQERLKVSSEFSDFGLTDYEEMFTDAGYNEVRELKAGMRAYMRVHKEELKDSKPKA